MINFNSILLLLIISIVSNDSKSFCTNNSVIYQSETTIKNKK